MERQLFPGVYRDQHGEEHVEWRLEPYTYSIRDRPVPGFQIRCTVRGIELFGTTFDALEAGDPEAAAAAGLELIPRTADITDCALEGVLPISVAVAGTRQLATISFTLDLHRDANGRWPSHGLRMSLNVAEVSYTVTSDSFENCLEEIDAALPADTRLACCLTCQWSAYQMYTVVLFGMNCNRDARVEHLAAMENGKKQVVAAVPASEWVPESYLCASYEVKNPPTAQQAYRKGNTVSVINAADTR
jgi:hypothetical protein